MAIVGKESTSQAPDIWVADLGANDGSVSGAEGARSKLGNPTNVAEAAALGRQVLSAAADAFAANVLPIIQTLQTAGVMDLRGLASALNLRGVQTARGGRWHVSNVKNLLDRVHKSNAALL